MARRTRTTYPHDAERIQAYVDRVDRTLRSRLPESFHHTLRDGTRLTFERSHPRGQATLAIRKGHERMEFSCYDEKEIKHYLGFVRHAFGNYPVLVRAAYRIHRWLD